MGSFSDVKSQENQEYANVLYCSFYTSPSVMWLDFRVLFGTNGRGSFSSVFKWSGTLPSAPWPRLYLCTSLRKVVHTCSPGYQQERSVGQRLNTAGGGNCQSAEDKEKSLTNKEGKEQERVITAIHWFTPVGPSWLLVYTKRDCHSLVYSVCLEYICWNSL